MSDIFKNRMVVKALEEMNHRFINGVWSRGRVNALTVLGENEIVHMGSQNCTAGLRGTKLDKPKEMTYLLSALMDVSVDHPVEYLHWLANESAYSSAFISKNSEEMVEKGVAIFDVNIPSNIMVGAIIATRCVHESTYVANLWFDLIKAGVSGSMAFLYAHSLKPQNGKSGLVVDKHDNSHQSLSTSGTDASYIKSFLSSSPQFVNQSYKESNTYGSIYRTWGDSGAAYNKEPWLINYLKANLKSTKDTNVNNPFAKAMPKKAPDAIGYNEGIARLVELEPMIRKELEGVELTASKEKIKKAVAEAMPEMPRAVAPRPVMNFDVLRQGVENVPQPDMAEAMQRAWDEPQADNGG